jgi:hypothetical protein
MPPKEPTVWPEEQRGAVTGSVFALDHADHNVDPVGGRRFTEPLRLFSGDIDRGVVVEPELLTAGSITRTYDKAVV